MWQIKNFVFFYPFLVMGKNYIYFLNYFFKITTFAFDRESLPLFKFIKNFIWKICFVHSVEHIKMKYSLKKLICQILWNSDIFKTMKFRNLENWNNEHLLLLCEVNMQLWSQSRCGQSSRFTDRRFNDRPTANGSYTLVLMTMRRYFYMSAVLS